MIQGNIISTTARSQTCLDGAESCTGSRMKSDDDSSDDDDDNDEDDDRSDDDIVINDTQISYDGDDDEDDDLDLNVNVGLSTDTGDETNVYTPYMWRLFSAEQEVAEKLLLGQHQCLSEKAQLFECKHFWVEV